MKHTPEPWRLWADCVPLDANGQAVIVALRDMTAVFRDPEVARRVVACVNACAGLPVEALEGGSVAAAVAALLAYHKANRIRHDAEAELYELSGPPLGALGKVRWDP